MTLRPLSFVEPSDRLWIFALRNAEVVTLPGCLNTDDLWRSFFERCKETASNGERHCDEKYSSNWLWHMEPPR